MLDANDAFDYTRARANDYAARARQRLAPIGDDDGRSALEALVDFAVARDH